MKLEITLEDDTESERNALKLLFELLGRLGFEVTIPKTGTIVATKPSGK